MTRKILIFLSLLIIAITIQALSNEEIRLIKDKELWDIAIKYQQEITKSTIKQSSFDPAWEILEELTRLKKDSTAWLDISKRRAISQKSIKMSIQTLTLARAMNSVRIKGIYDSLLVCFKLKRNKEILSYYYSQDEKAKRALLKRYAEYSKIMEEWAKEAVDEISTEPDNEKRIDKIENFIKTYPYSKYLPTAYNYYLYSLKATGDYVAFYNQVLKLLKKRISPEIDYIIASHTLDTNFRKLYYKGTLNDMILYQSIRKFEEAKRLLVSKNSKKKYFYPSSIPWEKSYFINKINLELAKANYFMMLNEKKLFDDEAEKPIKVLETNKYYTKGLLLLKSCSFTNNDYGELSAVNFWKAKFLRLNKKFSNQHLASEYLLNCLILNTPRNTYERDAIKYLNEIKKNLKIEKDLMTWLRAMSNYQGPIFEDISISAGLKDVKSSRVAWGDFDNDSYEDLLLNGNMLLKNMQNLNFINYTDSLKYIYQGNNGGLWADINQDGLLDFMTISSDAGDKLMLNKGDRFQTISDRAGSIDDRLPTEAAAWIDIKGEGYPDLYMANYEKWGEVSAYPDFYYKNNQGYLEDQTKKYTVFNPWYPLLAGRGVAPADYDNDGNTEFLVTNYRLNRNLFFKYVEGRWQEIANLNTSAGVNQAGYYGHSIGADWGDFDNDGDLDLFIANLAHPRFLDFSDISQLFRNDGEKTIKIDTLTISFTQMTNICEDSGITYAETHSDPLWFDADNDGDLDLYISSIYPNEGSFLYLNLGNSRFKDVTYLSGIRSFNTWGNAYSDINHDGKLDILSASSDGVKLFLNRTQNSNAYAVFKATWNDKQLDLAENWNWKNAHNTPAYGARLVFFVNDKNKTYKLIRELQSAKGTCSQNAQFLHFGLGTAKPIKAELWFKHRLIKTINY